MAISYDYVEKYVADGETYCLLARKLSYNYVIFNRQKLSGGR